MTTTRIPADRIIGLHAALIAALEAADKADDMALWIQLNEARATVKAYLVANLTPVAVEVQEAA